MGVRSAIGSLALLVVLWADATAAQCAFPFSGVTSDIYRINFTLLNGDPHGATDPAIDTCSRPPAPTV